MENHWLILKLNKLIPFIVNGNYKWAIISKIELLSFNYLKIYIYELFIIFFLVWLIYFAKINYYSYLTLANLYFPISEQVLPGNQVIIFKFLI